MIRSTFLPRITAFTKMALAISCCVFLLLASTQGARSQVLNGYYNMEKVLQSLPKYTGIRQNFKAKRAYLKDSLKELSRHYMEFVDRIPCTSSSRMLDSFMVIIKEKEQKALELQLYCEKGIYEEERLIIEKLESYVEGRARWFCRERGIAYTFPQDKILYCKDCIDFTEEFSTYLKSYW